MARGAAQASAKKDDTIYFVLPEGRKINGDPFVKDAYKDPMTGQEGTPAYKLEMAYEKGGEIEAVIDQVLGHCRTKYGDNSYALGIETQDNPKQKPLITMFLDGDDLAADREERGKKGDAYKGMWVIRANTIYNYDGEDGDGGIAVYDEATDEITAMDKGKVYNGCHGRMKVSLFFYTTNRGEPACKFYLVAFQKTADGEKLTTPQDHKSAFSPVTGRTTGDAAPARRSRKG